MQVIETASEGLKRHYKVVVSASDIEERVEARLKKLAKTVRLPGFRPGKAPAKLLKRQYGRSVMGEVLEEAVNQGSKKAIDEHALKPALKPNVEVTSFDEGKDLEFEMKLEVLPELPETDLAAIQLTRLVAKASDDAVEKSVTSLAESRRDYEAPEAARPAQDGDRVMLDFEGFVDGEAFEGGKGEDFPVVLGSGRMIPGFESGILGKEEGVAFDLDVTFPEDYGNEALKGKAALFKTVLKKIEAPKDIAIDDDLATSMGAENLDDLKRRMRERIESNYKDAARQKTKRQLLDHLAATHQFLVPEGMVDLEFDAIWKQLQEEMERAGETFESAGKSEEELRAEYRGIAERRVRLGLVLSDIGAKNEIKVEANELQAAVIEQARRFPGQEKQVFEFFQKTPEALEQVRAPIFEDKVCDYIFERAAIEDKEATPEEVLKDDEESETSGEEAAAS